GGAIGVTASSGPGIALKGEGIGLAVTAELPLVIFDVQRGGPSTGLPTKTEQADLMQALYGRNSESPIVVLAPATPGDCFYGGDGTRPAGRQVGRVRPPAASEPAAARPRPHPARVPPGARARDQQRPARARAARRVSRRRGRIQPRTRLAARHRRNLRGPHSAP